MRPPYGMRGQLDSKSKTCTERMAVDAVGISVKVTESYPGRSGSLSEKKNGLPASKGAGKGCQKSAEGIVGCLDRAEGPNTKSRTGA